MARPTVYWGSRLIVVGLLFALVFIAGRNLIPEASVTLTPGQAYWQDENLAVMNLSNQKLVVYPRFLTGLDHYFSDCPRRYLVMGGEYKARQIISSDGAFVITGQTGLELSAGMIFACHLNDYQHRWGELEAYKGHEWESIQRQYEAESWGLVSYLLNWSPDEYRGYVAALGSHVVPERIFRVPLTRLVSYGLEGLPLAIES